MSGLFNTDYPFWLCVVFTAFGVWLIGIAKAGFGGGVGFVTTPLMSLVIPPKFVIGTLLPLLIVGDAFVVWHYRRDFGGANLVRLLGGAAAGIVLGAFFLNGVNEAVLRRTLGVLALGFVALQWARERLSRLHGGSARLSTPLAVFAGAAAGFVSMVAHSAGVIVAMYLLPQRLDKRLFVGTMVLFFAVVNAAKLVPYVSLGLITPRTLLFGLPFVVFIPAGVRIGLALNRRLSERLFNRIILFLILFSGLNLLSERNLLTVLLGR